ncbi:hypothetical protein EIP91_008242 [Steccherinum ochraceum]|uniref:JmjC domain-containing protein n=1 Tax=Steccherinum ochraceum TaxID=92696 RepID=A0A4R0RD88_9APHY|nr:hypothetical protein EIP91_008242 [Steccherinum ochraceum]
MLNEESFRHAYDRDDDGHGGPGEDAGSGKRKMSSKESSQAGVASKRARLDVLNHKAGLSIAEFHPSSSVAQPFDAIPDAHMPVDHFLTTGSSATRSLDAFPSTFMPTDTFATSRTSATSYTASFLDSSQDLPSTSLVPDSMCVTPIRGSPVDTREVGIQAEPTLAHTSTSTDERSDSNIVGTEGVASRVDTCVDTGEPPKMVDCGVQGCPVDEIDLVATSVARLTINKADSQAGAPQVRTFSFTEDSPPTLDRGVQVSPIPIVEDVEDDTTIDPPSPLTDYEYPYTVVDEAALTTAVSAEVVASAWTETDVNGVALPALLDLASRLPFADKATDVWWAEGKVKTKGPWCEEWCEKLQKMVNVLSHDLGYVEKLADEARPAEECDYYTHIPFEPNRSASELAAMVKEALMKGHFVKASGPPGNAPEFNLDSIVEATGLPLNVLMQVLDAALRTQVNLDEDEPDFTKDYWHPDKVEERRVQAEKDEKAKQEREEQGKEEPEEPSYHVKVTVRQFIEEIFSGRVRALLDAPSMDSSVPGYVKFLDDAYRSYQVRRNEDPFRRGIPLDVAHARSWLLLHYGLFHTYQHFDSEGYATYVEIVSGYKFWVFTSVEEVADAKTRQQHKNSMLKHQAHSVEFISKEEGIKRWIVFAGPGDTLFQCPGQMHEVYTPVPTFTRGGHFYTYDTFHMTAATQRYSYSIGLLNTNHEHESAQLTTWMMINAIKYNDRSTYTVKGLAALCRMVLNPLEYWERLYDDPDLEYKRSHPEHRDCEMMDDRQHALYNAALLQKELRLGKGENVIFKDGYYDTKGGNMKVVTITDALREKLL